MKILITDGAGFMGSHLCGKYTKQGHSVLCLDNFMNGNLLNIRHLLNYRNFKLINGDFRDFDLLKKFDRNEFIERMREKGIGCSVHFIPLHLHPFYKEKFGFKKGDFPITEWVCEREVSLPLYPKMSEEALQRVIGAMKDILRS